MRTGILGLLLDPVGAFSIFLMTKSPSMIRPKTTCFRSKKSAFAHVMKNCKGKCSFDEKFKVINLADFVKVLHVEVEELVSLPGTRLCFALNLP